MAAAKDEAKTRRRTRPRRAASPSVATRQRLLSASGEEAEMLAELRKAARGEYVAEREAKS